jgi:hypothetical protein
MSSGPDFLPIFIGPNHSATASTAGALMDAFGRERCHIVNALTFVKPGELPSFARHLQNEAERILGRAEFPVFISSHHPLPLHVVLPNRHVRYMTMLRNPTRRFISYYHWALLHKDRDFHWVSPVIREGATLEEYVDHVAATRAYPGGLSPCEYFHRTWAALGLIPEAFQHQVVASARHVLETYFSVVGIAEMFEESLFVFSRALGLAEPAKWQMSGKSGAGALGTVPESVRAKIRHLVEPEMVVYMTFTHRFLERHRKDIEMFKSLGISLRAEGDQDRIVPFGQ